MSSQVDINPDSSSGSNSKDAMFEPKPKPKMIRVLTVLAYVLSVSMAAILLSIYYIFMWDGKPHLGAQQSDDFGTVEPKNYSTQYLSHRNNSSNISKEEFAIDVTNQVPAVEALRLMDVDDEREIITKNYEEEFNTTTSTLDRTTGRYKSRHIRDLPQQLTAIESEEVTVSSTVPTTTEEINVAWSDDYDEFEKSTFFKKIRLQKTLRNRGY